MLLSVLPVPVLTTSSLRQITKSSTFSFVVPQTEKKEQKTVGRQIYKVDPNKTFSKFVPNT